MDPDPTDVLNQSPPYEDVDLFGSDRPLQDAVAALHAAPKALARLMPKIASRRYDQNFRPWPEKTGITIGMGMTEKQGGTDVRANTTRAARAGGHYLVSGHKWFMSAPMCDAFL